MKRSTNPYLQTRDISGKFIFICYSHFDREIMEPIAEKLAKDGYRFWFDDGTRSGEAWQKIVSKEIRKCTVFLFLISEYDLFVKFNCLMPDISTSTTELFFNIVVGTT